MSEVRQRLSDDLKTAMKAGDARKKDALRFITAAIKQVEIDSRESLTDAKVNAILQTELKKRRDSLEEEKKMGRTEMADQTSYEIDLLGSYLPTQLTPDELAAEVAKAIAEAGATTPKDMGAVMKILTPRVKDVAPGKAIQEAVQAALRQNAV